MAYNYICIEGNIGAGKTTLCKTLALQLGGQFILEEFEENHLLPLFYKEPEKYAFPLEYSFLLDRFRQIKRVEKDLNTKTFVADYCFEKCLHFAKVNLNNEQYKLFEETFNGLNDVLPKPDVLIFMHCNVDHLLNNINKRNRSYELDMKAEYLEKVNAEYEEYSKIKRDFPVINFIMPNNSNVSYHKLYQEINMVLKLNKKQMNVTIEL